MILIISSILQSCTCQRTSRSRPDTQRTTQYDALNLSLIYIPGPENERAALILRVLNKTAIEASLKKEDSKIQTELSLKNQLKPYTLKMQREDWLNKLSFFTETDGGLARKINIGMKLIDAPKETELILGPNQSYQVVFEIQAGTGPKKDERLYLVWIHSEHKTISNKIQIPGPTQSKREEAIRQANVAYTLKDATSLSKMSDKFIQAMPNNPLGFWFMGLSYKLQGNTTMAGLAFKTAQSKMRGAEDPHATPPIGFIKKNL